MNNSIIKLLTGELNPTKQNDLFVLIAVIVFLLFAALLFIYLASCIIIVKQGTRKIVERFGSYNRTLKEGLHIIFRPFDRIAPVPWNILSISEREQFEEKMAGEKPITFYNDEADPRRVVVLRERLDRLINRDIRLLTREVMIDLGKDVAGGYTDMVDVDQITLQKTGERVSDLVARIENAKEPLQELRRVYHELGFDPYKADHQIIEGCMELGRINERAALASSVKYYPRHQDPHSLRHGRFPMAEHHIQDFVDLRERHIDTSNDRVRKLFALKMKDDIVFNKPEGILEDPARGNYKVLNTPNRFSGINLITKDNASVGANIVIFFSVTDPFLYYYGVDEPEESLVLLAITALRNIVSGLTLEEALEARATINKQIREELDTACNNWGIKANRVEVKEFELGYSMQKAMDDVLIAEREKRANILRAEGYRKMKDENVMSEHIKLRGYETLEEVSRGSANKVFIPSDLSDFITGAHVVADAFQETKKEKAAEKSAE